MSTEKTTGMLLGKFMPPHMGHVYLCDFARHYVDELSIVVGTLDSEPMPGDLRYRWMSELFPRENVIHLTDDLPQDPSEHPDFWALWQSALERILPGKPDYVFASERYGHPLAEVLGATFVPVDRGRSVRPVSGTAVRERPFENWELIPPVVRPYYLKRVCVFGPESTGKSTLAENLAKEFDTLCVPEYARTHLEEQGGKLDESDIGKIARGQVASEDALAPYANRCIVSDTDILLTTVWSKFLYGSCPEWIEELAAERKADLYLLTDVDVPWVGDEVRYLPENRSDFFDLCRSTLEANDCNFVELRGAWSERDESARRAVAQLFR